MWYEISYRFGYERGEFYMDQLRGQMSAEQIEQAELTALRWMIAYASRNPGSARLRREPVRPVPGSEEPAPGVQAL
jgi:hypothetical protein